ncbi:uncharacterized protein LOC135840497 isoform X1 [Planococcus citri]|uniref:uncharacterized protein LOC135840497 isoform X1 n=1 Tax=Planococcus citri TaxID=170843 RepID=UPI0031F99835
MFLLFAILSWSALTSAEIEVSEVNITRGQVFVYDLSKLVKNELQEGYHFTLSVPDGPDLPSWVFTKTDCKLRKAYLFGAPPIDSVISKLEIRICITTFPKFKTISTIVILNIVEPSDDIMYEIRIRISNSNIMQMLETNRSKELMEIFENYFWEQTKGKLYLTFLAASEDLGFRLPTSPSETAGVVLHLGSARNFSQSLIDLQNETMPLSKHCPEDFYKRVTVERFFRPKNFVVDWCFFKLVDYNECQLMSLNERQPKCNFVPYNFTSDLLSNDIEILTEKAKLPSSEMLEIFVVVVFIPSILVTISLLAWLVSFMCLHHGKLYDPYSDDYFDTVFYICEDCGSLPKDEECSFDEDFNKMGPSYDLI